VDRLEMEEGIAGHPGVAMSAIAAIPHGPGAHRFVAYVVPGRARAPGSAAEWSDPDQLLESVATHARRLLAGGLVPSAFAVLERLPVRANGKLDREALPAAEPTARWSAHVPPRDEMERLVADIWRSVLGREAIGVHDSFFELGGHSLLAIQVVDRLKRALGVELPVAALTRYRTLAELAARLSELGSAAREGGGPGSLVRLQSGTLPPALVLVHPAGGGVLCYGALTTWLFDRSVYAFEARDACADLPGLASRYVGELLDRGLDGAVCLGGWSLGGVVAFEIATQLVRRGARPVPVILIDSFTSECRAGEAGDPLSLVRAFLRDLSARQDTEPPPLPDDVGDRPPEAILALAHERMRAGGPPTDIELDGLLRRFDVFRGNLLALAAYRPAPYPGPVRLVQAAESPSAVEYWRRLSGDFQSFRLRGDHYGLLRASNAPLLANLLDRILDSSADSAPAAGDG
jgi:thioesterase domain-containing protein/acyl carrier protein